jgi:hypothetical protein
VLSSGDALRCAVSATISVVQVGLYLGSSGIDMLGRACGLGHGPRTLRAPGSAVRQIGPAPCRTCHGRYHQLSSVATIWQKVVIGRHHSPLHREGRAVKRQPPEGVVSTSISRRRALQLGAGFAGVAAFGLTGCTRATPKPPQPPEQGDGRGLVFLSTQLRPVEEAEKMRERILAGYDGAVNFVGSDSSPFIERVRAEAASGKGTVALVAAQHGDLASLASEGLLLDLTDLAHDLADRNFNPDFLELARLGHGRASYIPWAQSTYLMAARKEAVDMLQDGVDIAALSYDELLSWAARVNREQGGRKLGFPAAQDGLLRRFLQGYAYPSFTGRLHARFKSADAVTMWKWMRRAWAESNPRSPTYAFMHKPLQSGEVWIAWDHVARLVLQPEFVTWLVEGQGWGADEGGHRRSWRCANNQRSDGGRRPQRRG